MTDPASPPVTAPPTTTPVEPTPPWYPESVRDYVAEKGWKAPSDTIGSYQSLEKLFGADRAGRTFTMPKDEKDVEGWKVLRAKLGVPDSADKYELPMPEGEQGATLGKAAAEWFHQNGVPKAAAQKIVSQWNDHMKSTVTAQQSALLAESQGQLDKLKQEWGQNFEQNTEHARRFLKSSGWDEKKVALYEQVFGTADMLKTFSNWGKAVSEPGFSAGGTSSFNSNRAEIQTKIDTLRQQRISNAIDERTFHAQMELLGPQLEATRAA